MTMLFHISKIIRGLKLTFKAFKVLMASISRVKLTFSLSLRLKACYKIVDLVKNEYNRAVMF